MKKAFLLLILLCFSALAASAQIVNPPSSVPIKPSEIVANPLGNPNKKPSNITTESLISEREWKVLIDALRMENWDNAAFYSAQLINSVKSDNEQKQLAQLRYFYLYSLAGKILNLNAVKRKVEEEAAWRELGKAVDSFIGKEFVLPPRQFLGVCDKSLNYICTVKDNEKALRTTATNKAGTSIHSFDYVVFDQRIDLRNFKDNDTFLGGTLKKVEFNDDMSKPWVMYLIFEKGFVRVNMRN